MANIKDIKNYTVVDQPKVNSLSIGGKSYELPQKTTDNRNIAEKAIDFFGGEAARKRTGAALSALSPEYSKLTSAIESQMSTRNRLIDQIQKNKSIGKDTTNLQAALTQLERDINASTQSRTGMTTGGVSNLQASGSAAALGSAFLGGGTGVSTVGRNVINRAKGGFAGNLVKSMPFAKEAAGASALYGGGAYLGEAKKPTTGGFVASTIGGGVLGGVTGGLINKATGALAGKTGSAVARYTTPQEKRLAADTVYDFSVALGPSAGKKTEAFSKQYFGGESSKMFQGLKGLYENTKGLEITNLKGITKTIDFDNVDFADLVPMVLESKKKLATSALDKLEEVSKAGIKVNINNAQKFLRNELNSTRDNATKKYITNLLNQIDGLDDPIAIQTYLTKELGPKTGSWIQTGTDPIRGKINTALFKELETSLDDVMAVNSKSIRDIWSQYSGIKSFEKEITRRVSQMIRKEGQVSTADLVDDYGLAVLLSGVSYGNAMQASKGIGLILAKALHQYTKNPEVRLQSAFKNLDKYYGNLAKKGGESLQKGFVTPKAALGAGAAIAGGVGAANALNEPTTYEAPQTEVSSAKPNQNDLRDAFVQAENRGARDRNEDLYKVVGTTGDLGKYQVNPQSLKEWSPYWLDKEYSKDEFLNDSQAQEEFMNQFLEVVKAYNLSPQDAAVIWHKGWGVLGDSKDKTEKERLLRKHIDYQLTKQEVRDYVDEFNKKL